MRRYVVMPAMVGRMQRGPLVRSGLQYAPYACASWDWWCRYNDAEFRVIRHPVQGDGMVDAPPVIQRWMYVCDLLENASADVQIAVVDADTMIRWDTPDIFALAGQKLGVVQDRGDPAWIHRSLAAYQRFFPGIHLQWWEYFNAGMVVLNTGHLALFKALVELYRNKRKELETVQGRGQDVGVDQSVFNYLVRQRGEGVVHLPPAFNLVRCLRLTDGLQRELEQALRERRPLGAVTQKVHAQEVLAFIHYAYVWHFTNAVTSRSFLMRETWKQIRENYPGAADPMLTEDASRAAG